MVGCRLLLSPLFLVSSVQIASIYFALLPISAYVPFLLLEIPLLYFLTPTSDSIRTRLLVLKKRATECSYKKNYAQFFETPTKAKITLPT